MIGNVLPVWHAIAIKEDQVLALGRGHGAVEQDDLAKAIVRMPDMMHREFDFALPLLDEFAGLRAGAVIGNKNLVGQPSLAADAAQNFREDRRLLVGADD